MDLLDKNIVLVLFCAGARLVLHIVPLGSLTSASRMAIEPRIASKRLVRCHAYPLFGQPHELNQRYNVDGLLVATTRRSDQSHGSYLQVFRAGYLEAVDSSMISSNVNAENGGMPSELIEQELFIRIPAYIKFLSELGVAPPYVVNMSLIGVKGYCHLGAKTRSSTEDRTTPYFDRNLVRLPPVLLAADQLSSKITTLLEPLMHAFWQAGGIEAYPRYRDNDYHSKSDEVW